VQCVCAEIDLAGPFEVAAAFADAYGSEGRGVGEGGEDAAAGGNRAEIDFAGGPSA